MKSYPPTYQLCNITSKWWRTLTYCYLTVVSIDWAQVVAKWGCLELDVQDGFFPCIWHHMAAWASWPYGGLRLVDFSHDSWLAQEECSKRPGQMLTGFLRSSSRSHMASFLTPSFIDQSESQAQSRLMGRDRGGPTSPWEELQRICNHLSFNTLVPRVVENRGRLFFCPLSKCEHRQWARHSSRAEDTVETKPNEDLSLMELAFCWAQKIKEAKKYTSNLRLPGRVQRRKIGSRDGSRGWGEIGNFSWDDWGGPLRSGHLTRALTDKRSTKQSQGHSSIQGRDSGPAGPREGWPSSMLKSRDQD